MRPRHSTIALAMLIAFALSSCGDDPTPIIESSATPPPSPTATPTTTDPPDAEPARESAKDFIRRWQAETISMQLSGETGAYLAMTGDCTSCEALADSVSSIYSKGGSVVGISAKLSQLHRVGKAAGVLIFEYRLVSHPSRVLDADGNVERQFSGGTNRYQVNVEELSRTWRVRSVSRISA